MTSFYNTMAPAGQSHIDLSFAVLVGLGGVYGYTKAKSVPSLLGGLGFSAAYALTAYYINSVDAAIGHQIGCFTSAALFATMGMRLAKSGKVMPAGLLTGVGAIGTFYHYQKLQEWSY
ncbi:hypothetical protein CEUSTIGMA_g3060.t1 [Chlamydomonas eustigma]|uniref:Uncharacterized protein n=1 Tax=Chlamydomonas eustigma TaxID=1157962 RepID=A0A250WXW0_9CHLO|nr:hypothetical protein CEUSTIGMA_g3060.t1 [Chlamydomonas eustigma]|eukprot:GAX75616.1 hypothetical protein CEUSTIGMA_g3060.t1 [Chlamydomonas eustigma]